MLSYHPELSVNTVASVVVAGETIQYEVPHTIKPGFYKGAAAGVSRLQIGNLMKDKPAYIFYVHGLDPTKAQATAEAIARDIAKFEFIMHGEIEGDPTLNPLDIIQITGPPTGVLTAMQTGVNGSQPVSLAPFNNIQPFNNRLMYTNSIQHTFDMHQGFLTKFSAWHLRSAGKVLSDLGITGESAGPPIPVQ